MPLLGYEKREVSFAVPVTAPLVVCEAVVAPELRLS